MLQGVRSPAACPSVGVGRLGQAAHGLAEEAPVSKMPANATNFSSNQYEKREVSGLGTRYLHGVLVPCCWVGRNDRTVVGSHPALLVLIHVNCSHHYVSCCQS